MGRRVKMYCRETTERGRQSWEKLQKRQETRHEKDLKKPRKGGCMHGEQSVTRHKSNYTMLDQQLQQPRGEIRKQWKQGQWNRKKKANRRVKPSSTAGKLRVRGSKGKSTSWSLEISLIPCTRTHITFAPGQYRKPGQDSPGANIVDVVLQSQVLALHCISV